MSENEEKPQKILIEVTIPTKENVIDGIRKMFPSVGVKVIEDVEEEPQDP